MPQYDGTPVLTIGKFNLARAAVNAWFDKNGMGLDLPTPYKPGHAGPMWVLSLEGGPEDWPMRVSEDLRDKVPGVFFEPVTSWCLGLYPAPDAGQAKTDEQIADDYERAVATGNQWAQSSLATQMAKRLRDR